MPGLRRRLLFSLREACSLLPGGLRPCRSGGASSAALRPACACDRAGTSRGGAPRCSPPSERPSVGASDTPPRDARSGPARSGEIGLRPLGGFGHPPPHFAEALLYFFSVTKSLGLSLGFRVVGGGPSIRPSGEAAIAPEAAGSRPQELRAAASGGEQGPNAASPEGQRESLHAVDEGSTRPSDGPQVAGKRRGVRERRERPGRRGPTAIRSAPAPGSRRRRR